MKAVFQRDGLLEAAGIAASAVPNRDLKPVLKNLRLSLGDQGAAISATDMEVGVRAFIRGVEVHEPGVTLVPAKQFVGMLREFRGQVVTLESAPNSQSTLLFGDSLRCEFPLDDIDSFPDFPITSGDGYIEIEASHLNEMINRSEFAAAQETGRYSMTGVLWDIENDGLHLVATDGRRLAVVRGRCARIGDLTLPKDPVVPSKTMGILSRSLASEVGTVHVRLTQSEASFQTSRVQIQSRLVEGRFPSWRAVLPEGYPFSATIPVEQFHTSMRQAKVMANRESPRVEVRFEEATLTLKTQGAGNSTVQLEITYQGDPLTISLNPDFLIDMLTVLPQSKTVEVQLRSDVTPILLTHGEDCTYLVMPMT